MSRLARILVALAAVVSAFGLVFNDEIARYLFHPEGLSLAASEICLENRSQADVVVRLAVTGGATTITLVSPGEAACSASPEAGRAAMVRVGSSERAERYCEIGALAGQDVVLTGFQAPDGCEWAS